MKKFQLTLSKTRGFQSLKCNQSLDGTASNIAAFFRLLGAARQLQRSTCKR